MPRILDYLLIAATITFTVYGQMILKIRIGKFGSLPAGFLDRITFVLTLFTDPFILSGLVSAFLASLTWMAAMTKFPISHAYPFMSLSFVFVLLLSGILLHEQISFSKVLGVVLIIIGTAVSARG
ncbi:MAG: EamA family transporter [Hyphomicrobium sp.]